MFMFCLSSLRVALSLEAGLLFSALWVANHCVSCIALHIKYNKYCMYYTIAICIVHNPIAKLYFRGGENRFSGIPSEPTIAARHSADC